MSRNIKYIGMDVHREAIVIAVLNGSGKLVMDAEAGEPKEWVNGPSQNAELLFSEALASIQSETQ